MRGNQIKIKNTLLGRGVTCQTEINVLCFSLFFMFLVYEVR